MHDRVRVRLIAAGWREGYRYDTDGIAERLQQRGFTLFAAAREFLERYGGLHATGATTVWRGTVIYFHTDPDKAPTDPSWTEDWEQTTGTRVFAIGETAYRDYILIMDEHGRVFGIDENLVMTYWADDGEQLLDMILGYGSPFRRVAPEDRRPLPADKE
jgi:hypothetical protein